MAQRLDIGGVRRFAEHHLYRVAGNQMNKQKYQRRNPEDHRDRQQQAS